MTYLEIIKAVTKLNARIRIIFSTLSYVLSSQCKMLPKSITSKWHWGLRSIGMGAHLDPNQSHCACSLHDNNLSRHWKNTKQEKFICFQCILINETNLKVWVGFQQQVNLFPDTMRGLSAGVSSRFAKCHIGVKSGDCQTIASFI